MGAVWVMKAFEPYKEKEVINNDKNPSRKSVR